MNIKGDTLVECLVVLAIIAAFAGLLAMAAAGIREHKDQPQDPPQSWNLYTAQHDGHWFVKDSGGGVCHHPDCPCSGRKAEAEVGR